MGSGRPLAEQSFGVEASLGSITAPTLMAAGERDGNCGIDLLTRTRDLIPDAALFVMPGVGHLGSATHRGGAGRIVAFLGS